MKTLISQKALIALDMSFFYKLDWTETVGAMINTTLSTINKGYISGLIASLHQRPDDWARMITIENNIERTALEEDKEGLIRALREYEDFFDMVAIPQKDSKQIKNGKEVIKMKIKDMFPSKYLGKEDVSEPLTLTMRECVMEDIENESGLETKPVLYFMEYGDRGLILNKTNAVTLEDLYGDSDSWPGKTIEIFVDSNIRFGKQKIGGVRMRPPAQPLPQQDLQV